MAGRKPYPIKRCRVWFCPTPRQGGKELCTRHERQLSRTGGVTPIAGEDANTLMYIVEDALNALDEFAKYCQENACPLCSGKRNFHDDACPMGLMLPTLARRKQT